MEWHHGWEDNSAKMGILPRLIYMQYNPYQNPNSFSTEMEIARVCE